MVTIPLSMGRMQAITLRAITSSHAVDRSQVGRTDAWGNARHSIVRSLGLKPGIIVRAMADRGSLESL